MADLEGRLRRHSKAFEQLLNLIPAKHYFSASDSSTRWNKRKQTKEESQHAKKAKLDPDSIMSAADFGRKRQEKELAGGGEDEKQEGEAEGSMTKKQKRQKRELAKELKAAATAAGEGEGGGGGGGGGGKKVMKNKFKLADEGEQMEDNSGEAKEIQLNGFSFSTQLSHPPSLLSPAQSNTSSQNLKPTTQLSPEKRLEQKARLEARIQQLRAKRNADSPDGTSARNRNELMAVRRREEGQARKERKKEVRLKKATVEQTKIVGQPDRGKSSANAQRNASINPQTHNRDKEKGNEVIKKVNLRKSRPGFEGSLKASKKGKKWL